MTKHRSFLLLALVTFAANAGEWSGYAAIEMRGFPAEPLDTAQHDDFSFSLVAEPEWYEEWDDGRQSLTIVPFLRWDRRDTRRSHFDMREFTWLYAADRWELRLGVRKVFWGVTESQHLVDIINQTDLVENLDTEDKLGQPMINFAWINDWGTVDFFALPFFRERTFPGREGRIRTNPSVAVSRARFDSGAGNKHVDWAVRWSKVIGPFDVGIAHFSGTSRDPTLIPALDPAGNPVLIPFYPQIDQTGLDAQATLGNWLWKLEMLTRVGQGDRYTAAIGGFEYTFFGIVGTRGDLGILAEYSFDDRDRRAPTPFEDDLFVGARWTRNDAQSTEVLFGIAFDLDTSTRFLNLETSRRFGADWTAELELRLFHNVAPGDPIFSVRRDDHLQLEIARHF